MGLPIPIDPPVPGYGSAGSVVADCAEIFKPRSKMSVTDCARKYLKKQNQKLTYYMREPADCLTGRDFSELVFVGPARCSKTQSLVDNLILYTVLVDPADTKIFGPDEKFSSWYSKKRIDIELMGEVPELRQALRPGAHNDNVYDKIFRNGTMLSIGWPSKSQLAGRDIVRVLFTDYDRGTQNVGGEGSQFQLGVKRTQTFFTRAMAMAESSPSKPITDPKWRAKTPHEAPPTTGILGLYNGGDRRCLYGICRSCLNYFRVQPDISAMVIPAEGSIEYRSKNARLACPDCGETMGQDHERDFKYTGVWVGDGQQIDAMGQLTGERLWSDRASFWLPGWFAAFQSWQSIVSKYLTAVAHYEKTRDEGDLRTCINTDIGGPYIEIARRTDSDPVTEIQARAEPAERYVVPEDVRCLLAAVDVQGGKRARFEVLIQGIGKDREQCIVDRFTLTMSNRYDHDNGRFHRVNPMAYLEDWDVLTEKVLKATYKLTDGREMRVLRTAVDIGGEAKEKGSTSTARAYDWYRKLKQTHLEKRVALVKGMASRTSHRVRRTYPDGESTAKGEIPVLLINTDAVKDDVWGDITRQEAGPGFFHIPQWLDEKYIREICAETRTHKGWSHEGNTANETFDQLVYVRAMWIEMRGDSINWALPPLWARGRDEGNPEVITRDQRHTMKGKGVINKPETATIPQRPVRYIQRTP